MSPESNNLVLPAAGLRRRTLLGMLAAFVTGLVPLRLLAAEWNKPAFEAHALPEALKAIGANAIAESDKIDLKAPEIAENGAIVPVEITSRIPGTETVYIIAEKNPQPLVAEFDFSAAIDPFISTRIKMGETARVRVIVKAGGKFYATAREVKVTIGGCGG
jgi:sulfur-oxidizing protein SoxY